MAYVDASLDCPFLWPMLMHLWIVHSCGLCWCVFGLSILVAYVDASLDCPFLWPIWIVSLDCPFLWPMLMHLWIVHSCGLC